MPTTKDVGTKSASNDKIGGIPTIHYLNFLSRGRGQVVRLLFEDAGIAYVDVRYDSDEHYNQSKQSIIKKMNPTATMPVVELNGRVLTQSYPMLRHFARQLNAYDGATDDERYWADLVCDIASDWRTLFVQAFFSKEKDEYVRHCEGYRKDVLQALERHLSGNEFSRDGAFLLGERVTYADFVLYQILHDEGLTKDGRKGLEEYPRLRKLVDAMEERENVKKFLQSDRYLG
ncbi:glutathione S-transferase-like protein [Rhizodiscina lignyota]|uniref:Glutathione S-transferase-like protein n=1 Tax=Rhizodiscina lignyota TaxID=1504668 RepID=A0A9P4M6B2_9PEZI|nr:glutathione S-transferase-like protein [Rhizodiscina lignyota]